MQVYTPSSNLRTRLKTLLPQIRLCPSVFDISASSVVITDVSSAEKLLQERPELKLLVLSDTPNFEEGQGLLQLGIKGYANTYIHLLHLKQAIELINSGNIWLYPSFMQELIRASQDKNKQKEKLLALLTSREKETALQVSHGKSNKEIASELKITERTVKAHLSSIYEKTKISDRTSLALKLNG